MGSLDAVIWGSINRKPIKTQDALGTPPEPACKSPQNVSYDLEKNTPTGRDPNFGNGLDG